MHDGMPFSSADVKYTIDEVILPLHTRGGTYKSVIDRVETPDPTRWSSGSRRLSVR